MAANPRKTTGKQSAGVRSTDNELAELVKLAVSEAITEAIPALVQDVVAQLTSKTQELVDAQVGVLRNEMIAMRADISKCMDCVERDEGHLAEIDSRLSASVDMLTAHCDRLEEKNRRHGGQISKGQPTCARNPGEYRNIAYPCLYVENDSTMVSRLGTR